MGRKQWGAEKYAIVNKPQAVKALTEPKRKLQNWDCANTFLNY